MSNRYIVCFLTVLASACGHKTHTVMSQSSINSDSLYNRGVYFLDEDTDVPYYDSAIYYLEKASNEGNSAADRVIAEQYFFGYKVPVDTFKALKHINLAIERGDSLAYHVLSKFYYSKDIGKAIEYLKKGDNRYSDYELAQIFLSGYGFGHPELSYDNEINPEEGLKYLVKSAEGGSFEAQLLLSKHFKNGIKDLLTPDTAKARYYFEKAIKNPEVQEIPGITDELEKKKELDY